MRVDMYEVSIVNAKPQPTNVILRRSDRISKPKERMSTSTSSAELSSVVISQTAPLPRAFSIGLL